MSNLLDAEGREIGRILGNEFVRRVRPGFPVWEARLTSPIKWFRFLEMRRRRSSENRLRLLQQILDDFEYSLVSLHDRIVLIWKSKINRNKFHFNIKLLEY